MRGYQFCKSRLHPVPVNQSFKLPVSMKRSLLPLLIFAILSLGAVNATAGVTAPKSIIHVVTVAWKAEASPEQIKAALDGVQALPAAFPGITHVWTKTIKLQDAPGATIKKSAVFVMEFADAAAFKAYTDSDAQKAWYKVYLPIREQSTTFDISN